RAAVDNARDLVLRDVEHANAIGALIGRRQRALVDARRREGRSTERDKDQLPVVAWMNAAWPLAERQGRDGRRLVGLDDGHVARGFVGDVDEIAWFGRRTGTRRRQEEKEAEKFAHDRMLGDFSVYSFRRAILRA